MAIYSGAHYRPLKDHDGGPMSQHLGLILHVAVGDASLFDWFSSTTSPNRLSSNFWVGKDGTVEQYLDSDLVAWAEGAGNSHYDSVETAGYPNEELTNAQVDALAKLYRWGHDTHGWPYQIADSPGVRGFGVHSMGGAAWGGHYQCPGKLRASQRQHVLNLAQGKPAPGRTKPTKSKEDDIMAALPLVKRGQHDKHVGDVQALVTRHGHRATVDNIFGPGTERAVKAVQRDYHISVDGQVGPITWHKLLHV